MKKIVNAIKKWFLDIRELYSNAETKGMVLMSLSFVIGFLWALLGLIIYLVTKMRNAGCEYGKLALTGCVMNLILYVIQISIRIF